MKYSTEIALIGCSISYFTSIINWLLTFLCLKETPSNPFNVVFVLQIRFFSDILSYVGSTLDYNSWNVKFTIIWTSIWDQIQQFDLFNVLFIEWSSYLTQVDQFPIHVQKFYVSYLWLSWLTFVLQFHVLISLFKIRT